MTGSKHIAQLFVKGPMRLVAQDGTDCTPKGNFRKALLAILALSPRQSKARKALLSMFWGESEASKASGSLRSALSTLRSELAPLGADVIQSDTQAIWLKPGAIWVDALDDCDTATAELLEGLDLPNNGAEGFEEWLRGQRQSTAPDNSPPPRLDPMIALPKAPEADPAPMLSIALVDPLIGSLPHSGHPFCDSFIAMLSDGLADLCQAEILDYRWHGSNAMQMATSSGASHVVTLAVHPIDDGILVSVKLSEAARPRVLWQSALPLGTNVLTDPQAPEAIEAMAYMLDNLAPILSTASAPQATTFHLLSLFFRLDPDALTAAGQTLANPGSPLSPKARHALVLYLQTLRIGETWGQDRTDYRNDMLAHTRSLLSDGPTGGVHLSLTGYALHYLAQEDRLAFDMMSRATEISPTIAMAWDHLALYHFHRGKLARARQASGQALALSRHSPFRYAFETTRCMIAFAEGDHLTATHFGQLALARMPSFSAALRYTAASLGFLNRHDEAEALKQSILKRDPSFNASRVASGIFRTSGQEINDTIARGLARIGLD
ncbi:MAG: hypothetical protein N4A61_07250 [Pelagimonas sp.]|nr:hypothetical protein [Pelagimonas sp.]